MAAAGGSIFQRFWAWRKANPYREYFMSTHFWVSKILAFEPNNLTS